MFIAVNRMIKPQRRRQEHNTDVVFKGFVIVVLVHIEVGHLNLLWQRQRQKSMYSVQDKDKDKDKD